MTRVLGGGSAVHGIEYSARRGDDSRIVLSVNAAPIRGEDGGLRRVVASFRDVTERKQFEARLEHRALHDDDWLRENGCEEAQGYGLTRPVPIGELGEIVDGAG